MWPNSNRGGMDLPCRLASKDSGSVQGLVQEASSRSPRPRLVRRAMRAGCMITASTASLLPASTSAQWALPEREPDHSGPRTVSDRVRPAQAERDPTACRLAVLAGSYSTIVLDYILG
jgi:hypothetical protein